METRLVKTIFTKRVCIIASSSFWNCMHSPFAVLFHKRWTLANIELGFVSNLIRAFVLNLPPLAYLAYFRCGCLERYWPGPSSAARETSWLQGISRLHFREGEVNGSKERVFFLFLNVCQIGQIGTLRLQKPKKSLFDVSTEDRFGFQPDWHSLHSTKVAVKSSSKKNIEKLAKNEPSGRTRIFSDKGSEVTCILLRPATPRYDWPQRQRPALRLSRCMGVS